MTYVYRTPERLDQNKLRYASCYEVPYKAIRRQKIKTAVCIAMYVVDLVLIILTVKGW